MEYYVDYQRLRQRLVRTQRKELLLQFAESEAWAGTVAVVLLVLAVVAEALLFGSSGVRRLLWQGWLVVTGCLLLGAALPVVGRLVGLLPRESLESLALRIGRHYPQLGDMLCNALQLVAGLSRQRGVSEELAVAAFARVAQQSQGLDFEVVLDRRRVQRAAVVFFALLGAASVLIGGVAPLRMALQRLVFWERSFLPPAPFTLRVAPQDTLVLRGSPVQIRVTAEGIPPAVVQLHLFPEGGKEQVREVRSEQPGVFVVQLGRVESSVRFYASARWMGEVVASPHGSIRVGERPVLRALWGEVRPPAYTRLQPIRIDEQATELVVPRGSVVWLRVESSKPVRQARVLFVKASGDTVRFPLQGEGHSAQGEFPLPSSGSWAVVVTDEAGQQNDSPLWYRVMLVEDAPPQITLLQPTTDVELSEKAIVPLRVGISDDYGFSRLLLHYRLAASRYAPPQREFRAVEIPFVPMGTVQEVPYLWDLSALRVSPEDRYEFYVEVWDNDRVTGPKSARTPVVTVYLPSLERLLRESEQVQERVAQELQELARELEQLSRRSEEVQRRVSSPAARQPQGQWEQQRHLQELLEQHQQVQQRVEQLQQQLQEAVQRLEQSQMISPETLQKYRELQQLLSQVRSPQLEQMMERLQQALRQLTPEQVRQALQNFRFNEEEFRAAVERTLRLLKRLQAEQKLDALRQRLERLAEEQERLQQESERASSPERLSELAQRQEEIEQQWQQLQQEWQQLERSLQEVMPEAPPEAMQRVSQQMQDPATGEALRQSAMQLRQGQPRQAQQAQRRASSQMRSAAAALQQLWNQLQQNLTREIQRQLQKAVMDALELSEQQEQLHGRVQTAPPGSQRLAEFARRQRELQSGLSRLVERVMGVAQKSFVVTPQMARELGMALRSMQNATAQLAERAPEPAARAQQEAMEALNRSALLLQDALSALQAGGSGACPNPGMGQGAGGVGFLERLQQLAAQQQGITHALQELFQGRLTPEQQAQLARLAAQQAQVQQALEDLARQQQAPGSPRLLGDLRRLSEEMREVVEELRSGNLTMETLRRQHRILSRMLDAMRSLYERDYEPQREARPGQDIVRPSPPGLRLPETPSSRVPEDMLRLLRQGYSRDYQRLIERYFDLLQRRGSVTGAE